MGSGYFPFGLFPLLDTSGMGKCPENMSCIQTVKPISLANSKSHAPSHSVARTHVK